MKDKRKKLIALVLVVMFAAVAGLVSYYWYEKTHYVATEDAKVTGDIVKISTQMSGKILELNFSEGQRVEKDQILGRLEFINQPDSNIEMSIIRAPISGLIIKTQGNVGEMAAAGQLLGMIIDPEKLYITANIEETDIDSVNINQIVDIKIDQKKGKAFSGRVSSIGTASNSTFSLLPSSSGSTYTKVVQKIPVKIAIDKHDDQLMPGTNSSVKIHLK